MSLKGLENIEGLSEDQIAAINNIAGGLITKNEELLGKISTTKQKVNEGLGAAEKLAAMEALQAQKELESKQQYDEALNLTTQKYTKQIEELSNKVTTFEQEKQATLINKSINNALTDVRVNPLHMEYVSSYFKTQAKLDGDQVLVGDKSLSETIKEWADTDQGKAVRLAPDNSGGDAIGSNLKSIKGSGSSLTKDEQRAADINKRFGIV